MPTGMRSTMHYVWRFIEEIDNAAACLNASRTAICKEAGVRLEQWRALAIIDRSARGLSISQLGRRLRRTRQSVHSLAQGLERAGWIQLAPNPDDRRILLIGITRRGKSVLSVVDDSFRAWLLIMSFDLSEEQLRKLIMTLRSVRARVSRARDYAPPAGRAAIPRAGSRTAVP